MIIAGNGDSIFLRLMDVIERPDLGADPALGENAGRWARRDELDDAIGAWTATVSAEEALERLDDAGVPAARPSPPRTSLARSNTGPVA